MKELISLYDNALIYYPNVFFPALFFLSILAIVFVSIVVSALIRKIRSVAKEIKIKSNNKKKKASFVSIIIVFLKRNKIFFIQVTKVFLIRTNTLLVRLNLQIEKIIKKVGKEILIDK